MIRKRPLGTLVILLMFAAVTHGDDSSPVPSAATAETEETPVVLRVSKELIEYLTRDVIEMSIPIDTTVEEMKLKGEASGTGLTSILMNETDERAELVLSISGNAVGTMRSDVGLANVFISSRARFTTQKRIHYDGELFRDEPATTETRNCTSVDRICPKRRGIIGCLVRRVGRRKADEATPELNIEAEKVTRETLSRKFDESVVDLMAQLNESTELDELVEKYFPETEAWTTRSVTRPTFLVAGAGPDFAIIPEFLVAKENEPQALSELWLRTTPGQAALLQLMADLDAAYDMLRDVAPDEDSDEVVDDVKVSSGGASLGWFSPLEIDDLRIESSDGSVDIDVEHLSGGKSWLLLWLAAPDLGKIDFIRPQIKLIVDEQDEEAPERQLWPSFSAVITNGSLLVRERTQTEPAIDVNSVDIRLQIQRRGAGSVLIVDPIQLVQREALTPDVCEQGLQLVAPELSDEISLEGEYSLKLTGLEYPLGADETDPRASIEGVVTLHQVTAGLKNDVTRRLALLAAELSDLGEVAERIRLAENVELAFRFQGGRISHDGMAAFFPELVPGLSIRSTGSVGMDESLDLQVFMQIPMSAASDSALAEELSKTPIELRVAGTIDEPKLSVPEDQPWFSILKEQPSSAEEQALAAGLIKALDDYLNPALFQKGSDPLRAPSQQMEE